VLYRTKHNKAGWRLTITVGKMNFKAGSIGAQTSFKIITPIKNENDKPLLF
jgi:hypothetical protein